MFQFLFTSIVLGIGLAMDACAVSMANGFAEPKMKLRKVILIALMFGIFQGVMPLIGYFIGYTIIGYIEKYIPWIALLLLGFLGGKMLFDAVKDHEKDKESCKNCSDESLSSEKENIEDKSQSDNNKENNNQANTQDLTFKGLFLQAIATSIDALSVGITIADYTILKAIICASIVAVVTFGISFGSVFLGKKFGTKFGRKAEIFGGIVLILIGIEIFITGII